MKTIFRIFSAAAVAALLFTSCETERITYDGPSYIAFADTLNICPVTESGEAWLLPVAATTACGYDRTFGVELIPGKSNAVYGKHFTLESQSVTIKAGENVGYVGVVGNYGKIGPADSLAFTLRLALSDKSSEWDLYGDETRVLFRKICPFDLKTMTNWSEHEDGDYGWCVTTSSFLMSYNPYGAASRLCRTFIVDEEKNIVRIEKPYYDKYDITVQFDYSDPLDPRIRMVGEQPLADTRDCFNTIYGNGEVLALDTQGAPNTFEPCQQYAIQYVNMRVDGVGLVGTFVHMFEWIDDEEAEEFRNQNN